MLGKILNPFFRKRTKRKSLLIDHNVVAPFKYDETDILFNQNRSGLEDFLKYSYAIHWFNGCSISKKFINEYSHVTTLKECTLKNIMTECSLFTPEDYTYFNKLKKVSIVIAYLNNRRQLFYTLDQIVNSKYKNIEVIIVNDGSDKDLDIKELYSDKISSIKIVNTDLLIKTWKNLCMAYHIGIKEATGDIVIMQSSEVLHIGDCISYVVKNLRLNQLLTLTYYKLCNFAQNNIVYQFYKENKEDEIYNYVKLKSISSENTIGKEGVNHYRHLFTASHYFGAIYRRDLNTKMISDFDINTLISNKIELVNKNDQDQPFTVHLHYTKYKSFYES
jgi:hypothetical protein